MEIRENDVVFLSGRICYATGGRIGLAESSGDGFFVTYGYDGEFSTYDLTKAEREELADYMIGLWKRFKVGTD